MTRAEKFKEVFGLKIDVEYDNCGFFDCSDRESCELCPVKYTKMWWNGEYEAPSQPQTDVNSIIAEQALKVGSNWTECHKPITNNNQSLTNNLTNNDRAVSLNASIDAIERVRNYHAYDEIEELKKLPSVTPQPQWIPVSERLPEPNRLVLCYITTGTTETYFLAFWNDFKSAWEEGIGGCRLLEHDLGYEVIAWMPLPPCYEPQESEE